MDSENRTASENADENANGEKFLSKTEFYLTKAEMDVYPAKRKAETIIAVALDLCLSLLIAFCAYRSPEWELLSFLKVFIAAFICTFPCCVVILMLEELKAIGKREQIHAYKHKRKGKRNHDQPSDKDKTPAGKLGRISYRYLKRYYKQTQKQAQQGFVITVLIAVFGAIVIFCGVGYLLFGGHHEVQEAVIACAFGAVTEFISAVFFYLYNKTVMSMNSYHDKLILSQNVVLALRAADTLGAGKEAAKREIIRELIKDINAQMMKSDADADKPPTSDIRNHANESDADAEDQPSDSETAS